jgi:hypothetical protein
MGKVGVGYDSAEKLPLYDSYGMFVSTGRCDEHNLAKRF